ncbi:MAG TPA: coagulation factor 5/8 type domain-containing protein [Solirubrobacteraceae bacterium]|nr:coagulation factor 5/8 type domain-containing protein [Solirubrobacteraceae bacterium]
MFAVWVGLALASAGPAAAATPPNLCPDANVAAFGPYVCVFSPAMAQSAIQADLNAIATQQVPIGSQFDGDRYAILFEPGTYGSSSDPLVFQVGYYTEVAGLGAMPQDTVINGSVDVFNNACTAGTSNCNSDDNFWRSLSNLSINVTAQSTPSFTPAVVDAFGPGCANSAEMWSVSQAAPIRRAIINGSVVFQDYCANDDYASGGFIADSRVSGDLDFYGNQQYMVRNSSIGGANGCPNGLWNMVYSGVVGAPAPVFSGSCQQNTVLATSPVTEEEPFLYMDATQHYDVFVPAVQTNSSGPSWGSGSEAGSSLKLSSFFIANPATPVAAINLALAFGQNLILTPGIYDLRQPIVVSRPNTVVLGLGLATLIPQTGNAAMIVIPNNGVKLSGLIIDAGPVNSPVLLSVGLPGGASASDPDLVQDVFFRVGGAATTPVSATVSMLDNASHSILDDIWVWRADHGNDVGWTVNKGDNGLIVTGDDVTAYGLAVEHFQKTEVLWSGQGGTDVFFQNELPYDVPDQAAWTATPSQDGYPAFQVSSNVKTFNGYGMGSYSVFDNPVNETESFEAPTLPTVQFSNIFTININGVGAILSVIDGTGPAANSSNVTLPQDVTSYP